MSGLIIVFGAGGIIYGLQRALLAARKPRPPQPTSHDEVTW